jgi:hypothetical protein
LILKEYDPVAVSSTLYADLNVTGCFRVQARADRDEFMEKRWEHPLGESCDEPKNHTALQVAFFPGSEQECRESLKTHGIFQDEKKFLLTPAVILSHSFNDTLNGRRLVFDNNEGYIKDEDYIVEDRPSGFIVYMKMVDDVLSMFDLEKHNCTVELCKVFADGSRDSILGLVCIPN